MARTSRPALPAWQLGTVAGNASGRTGSFIRGTAKQSGIRRGRQQPAAFDGGDHLYSFDTGGQP